MSKEEYGKWRSNLQLCHAVQEMSHVQRILWPKIKIVTHSILGHLNPMIQRLSARLLRVKLEDADLFSATSPSVSSVVSSIHS